MPRISRPLAAALLFGALATPAFAQGYQYGQVYSPYGQPLPQPAPGVWTGSGWSTDTDTYADPAYDATPRARPGVRAGTPAPTRVALPPDADPNYSSLDNYDDEVDPQMTRQRVSDPTGGAGGQITIDTARRKLYLSLGDGTAVAYGIGVGREGFLWKGVAKVGRKAVWPGWTPPKEMVARRPDLPSHMDGGMENPLGARALYLFQGSKDTLFRIHGTNEPDTIGHAVSSGCIRMLNADVMDLYKRVPVGATVNVI